MAGQMGTGYCKTVILRKTHESFLLCSKFLNGVLDPLQPSHHSRAIQQHFVTDFASANRSNVTKTV